MLNSVFQMLTVRDREYLRAIFILYGSQKPVGPVLLADKMGVSKECAFQEMRRLDVLGYGEYVLRKGLKLNKLAISIVENDFKKHHFFEKFLQETLGMTHEEACHESSCIDPFVSEYLMQSIYNKTGTLRNGSCGCRMKTPLNPNDLKDCHWINESF